MKGMLCLYEDGTLFILSQQDGTPLETDGILAKAGPKSRCKCSLPEWFWIIKHAYIAYYVIKSIQWIRKKIKMKYLNQPFLEIRDWESV